MKKLLALLLAVIMIFALAACGPTEGSGEGEGGEEGPQYGGHLNISSNNITGNLDPCNVGGIYHWNNLIWESPLSRNADGTVAPGVCNFELSEDQLTLKLWVREGIKFHDGSLVEIDDVVASMLRKGHKSPKQYVIDMLAEQPTVKDGVATFKFKTYSEKTMYYIAAVRTLHAVLPKEFVEKYPGNAASPKKFNVDPEDAIGTGPYKVDSERDGEWLKLVRFDGYVKSDASLTGAAGPKNAYFDSVTFVNRTDGTAAIIQVLANDLDVIDNSLEGYETQFEMNNLSQTKMTGTKSQYLLFNQVNQQNQVHDDVNLRKAICAALDFEELNEHLWGSTWKLGGAPALDDAYYLDNWDKADYMGKANLTLAQQYLAKSNYKGEEIYFLTEDANLATLVKNYLEAAGMKVKADVKTDSAGALLDAANYWNFTFTRVSIGNTPSTLVTTQYERGWVSAEKDSLVATIASTIPGSKDYMDAWKDLAEIWVDDCAAVFIGHDYSIWTHHKDLVVTYEGTDIYIWNWYWKNPAEHAEKK